MKNIMLITRTERMHMTGAEIVRVIESILAERGIKKGEFYDGAGITATALYGWRKGAVPKQETLTAIENYLGIQFEDYESYSSQEDLEKLRDDLRVLLKSARDLPPSSVYALIAEIEREKENEKKRSLSD